MHYNPCGLQVDWARRSYKTACRFFFDSDIEIPIVWYPVAEGAGVLPFPSKINSLEWDDQPWTPTQVGEVWNVPREYAGKKAIPYAVGLTPCEGAKVFAEGESYNPELPPTEYNEDQFPLCCLNITSDDFGLVLEFDPLVTVPSCASWSCSGAVPLVLGVAHNELICPFGNQWWYHDCVAGQTYHITIPVLPGDVIWTPAIGPNCSSLLPLAVINPEPNCFQYTPATTSRVYHWFNNLVGTDQGYQFTVSDGPC